MKRNFFSTADTFYTTFELNLGRFNKKVALPKLLEINPYDSGNWLML